MGRKLYAGSNRRAGLQGKIEVECSRGDDDDGDVPRDGNRPPAELAFARSWVNWPSLAIDGHRDAAGCRGDEKPRS